MCISDLNKTVQYYGGQGAPVQQQQQQASAPRPTPVRKSHALQIIDPTTGKAVELGKKDKAAEGGEVCCVYIWCHISLGSHCVFSFMIFG